MVADPVLTVAASLNGKYMLKLSELGSAVKQLVLEQVVLDRLGEAGGRLYRILLRHHANGGCKSKGHQKLELKQIAELALLPERDTRPLLMRLLQDELVMLQEVPRTADRNPKTTFYLWHVSLPHAYRALEAQMLKTLDHLHVRLAHEVRLASGAVGNAGDPSGWGGGHADHFAEGGGEKEAEKQAARRRADYLEATILKLHQTVLLLRVV